MMDVRARMDMQGQPSTIDCDAAPMVLRSRHGRLNCPRLYADLEVMAAATDRSIAGLTPIEYDDCDRVVRIDRACDRLREPISFPACFVVGEVAQTVSSITSTSWAVRCSERSPMRSALYNRRFLITCVGSLPTSGRDQFEFGPPLGPEPSVILVFVRCNLDHRPLRRGRCGWINV